jgi:uncharacterized membrane protein HdeD (DUF308 family)
MASHRTAHARHEQSLIPGSTFVFLGWLALVEPTVVGVTTAVLAGWLLIAGGLVHLIGALREGGAGVVVCQVILAILYVSGGADFLTHPLAGSGALTLLLAAILAAEACLRAIAYGLTRGRDGSAAWLLVSAVVTLLLSGMIWRQWPSGAESAIGTLLGLNLLTTGVAGLLRAIATRRSAVTPAQPEVGTENSRNPTIRL